MIGLVFMAMASAAPTAATPAALPKFPMIYRGDWFAASKNCDDAKVAIRVEESSIRYFDEFTLRRILAITQRKSRSMTIMAEYGAEGHRWKERVELQFSPDRRGLTVVRNSLRDKTLSETMKYKRCSAIKKTD